ncbi:helix-turn-helix domain-containing protein [Dysgonomonas sp. Marseille-P4677]|uniref:LexA family transcriptional regulator n=1 Tax=Dysgonomonas sp. Marseille-P4677 TaxID=2364790 RepID=UPI001914024E|nr:XRE family transcriptional regulator [Dysgonomonas sp. Marseille-P4677]MBK5723150.1 helix-turn-helix domain-containing protein [Dysgonomonas sp. Marseille-P4677]
MEFKDRLKYLLEKDGVTAYRIWKDTNITKGTIANYTEGKTNPNKSNIAMLASYFRVSEEWLATGRGDMIRNERVRGAEPYLVTKSGVKYYEMADGKYRMRVPFIPVKAYAKYIDECRDAEFVGGEFEEFDFIVDKIGLGRYFAFEIKGDSMDNDTKRSLSNGDIVLARELKKEHWRNKLHTDDFPNWVIVLDNTILCKQIIDQNLEKGTILCHSLNLSPEYTDFELKLNDVCQLCNIVQRVSSVFK